MNFIAISDDMFINVDKITAIRRNAKGQVRVVVEGHEYHVEKNLGDVISKLIPHGLGDVEQFWAG